MLYILKTDVMLYCLVLLSSKRERLAYTPFVNSASTCSSDLRDDEFRNAGLCKLFNFVYMLTSSSSHLKSIADCSNTVSLEFIFP
jgi:hypothetical protein